MEELTYFENAIIISNIRFTGQAREAYIAFKVCVDSGSNKPVYTLEANGPTAVMLRDKCKIGTVLDVTTVPSTRKIKVLAEDDITEVLDHSFDPLLVTDTRYTIRSFVATKPISLLAVIKKLLGGRRDWDLAKANEWAKIVCEDFIRADENCWTWKINEHMMMRKRAYEGLTYIVGICAYVTVDIKLLYLALNAGRTSINSYENRSGKYKKTCALVREIEKLIIKHE